MYKRQGEKVGIMGSTGKYSSGVHCHVEFDRDITYWQYTPSLSGNSNKFKAGVRGEKDTTVNPLEYLHVANGAPFLQQISGENNKYVSDSYLYLPQL